MLRATIAVCEVRPPTSVTKPRKTPPLNCSMSAGEMSLATSTSGSAPASRLPRASRRHRRRRRRRRAPARRAGARPPARGRPCARAGTRPPSRRTGAPALRAAPTAPTRRCSGARGSTAWSRRSACRRAAASGARRAAPTAPPALRAAGRACIAASSRRPRRARSRRRSISASTCVFADVVVRDVDPAGGDEHRPPDRDAPRDRQAEELEAHAIDASSDPASSAVRSLRAATALRRTCRRSERRSRPSPRARPRLRSRSRPRCRCRRPASSRP